MSVEQPLSPTTTKLTGKKHKLQSPTASPDQLATKRPKTAAGAVTTQPISQPESQQQQQEVAMEVDGNSNGAAANGNGTAAGDGAYDEQLYSRQIYALGATAMHRLRTARVLVSGMGGVGVEVAKNLILGGVRHVTIQDTQPATWMDLSAQYYLKPADLGQNRAARSVERLAELNDTVTVSLETAPVNEAMVKKHDVVILTDATWNDQIEVSKMTRAAGRKLIVADAKGLFGRVFCDFGDAHTVEDKNGEQCQEFMIDYVDRDSGDVTTLEQAYHGLEDGDFVEFREVKGMEELNGAGPLKVTTKNAWKFNIGDAAVNFGTYKEGGICRLVKVPVKIQFKSLQDFCDNPEFVMDWSNFEKPAQSWLAWQALYCMAEKEPHKRYPHPHDDADAALMVEKAKELNSVRSPSPLVEEVDEKLVTALAKTARGNLIPMCGFVGGVAAQEGMKAVTSFFTPIQQCLMYSAEECLPPADLFPISKESAAPRDSRYDGQVAVFGQDVQQLLQKQRWFVVGSGAIGCELLKYFSMMGLAAGPEGKLQLTDMDSIEMSNLNRQFLFRRNNIGHKKAEVAAAAARGFNPDLNIEWMNDKVCAQTEEIFGDAFFEKLHGVANALDNVEARAYMDRRCLYYQLPLLESGTLGPKGNVQVVFPELTESYSDSHDPPEKSIPICTVKNFPNAIEHCIQWSRELFEGFFSTPAESANQYIEDPRGFKDRLEKLTPAQKCSMLQDVKKVLVEERPKTAQDCIRWARKVWEDYFNNHIRQLLFNFPEDQVTSQGAKFWSGAKRCPHHLVFDPENEEHLDFVWSAACLRAEMYNLEPVHDKAAVKAFVRTVQLEPFTPRSGVTIAVTDQEAADMAEDGMDEDSSQQLKVALAAAVDPKMKPLSPIEFEKDDDANKHLDFMTTASNLRAENYKIDKADKMKTKQIAGRIIPALATTTAATAGLVALELYKVVMYRSKGVVPSVEVFNSSFLNLALSLFSKADPIQAPVKKYADTNWTIWSCIDVQGDITLGALFDLFKEKYNLEISMLSQGVSMLYAFFMPPKKQAEKKSKTIKQLVEIVTNKPIPAHMKALVLEVMVNDEAGEDVEVPYIKYHLP